MHIRRSAPLLAAFLLVSVTALWTNPEACGQGLLKKIQKVRDDGNKDLNKTIDAGKKQVGKATATVKKEVGKGTKTTKERVGKAAENGKKLGTTAKAETQKGMETVKKNVRKSDIKLPSSPKQLGGDLAREGKHAVGDTVRETKQAAGTAVREGKQAGKDVAREGKRVPGDIARESKLAVGEFAREGKRAAGDAVRETKRDAGIVAREGKHAAGDIAREGKHAAGDVARETKRLGGDIAREGKHLGGDAAREGKHAAGDISREGKHAGGDVAHESRITVDKIKKWPGELGKNKADPFAFGTLLGRNHRDRRPIVISDVERNDLLRESGYTAEQREILDQILWSGQGLQGQYAEAFDAAVDDAFKTEFDNWWRENGAHGAELTDAEMERLTDAALAKGQTAFLRHYGLDDKGAIQGGLGLADDPYKSGSIDKKPTDDLPPSEITPNPKPDKPSDKNSDRKPTDTGPIDAPPSDPEKECATMKKTLKEKIRREFPDRFKQAASDRLNNLKKTYSEAARDTTKAVGLLRDKAVEVLKEKGEEKAIKEMEKLITPLNGVVSVGGAVKAHAIVRDMLGEYQDATSAPVLKRDKESTLVLPHDKWGILNTDGWSSTRNAALDRVTNNNMTVYQDANGNWYQNSDPKFVPGGPFTVLYRPVPRQPDGGTIKEERGTATDKDKTPVSEGKIVAKVMGEHVGEWALDKAKEKIAEKKKAANSNS